MGEYFLYANLDRREYFHVHALGGGNHSSGVGRNLGARALGLLIMVRRHDSSSPSAEGSWAGDRVVALGDYATSQSLGDAVGSQTAPATQGPPYAFVESEYKNVVSSIVLMLIAHDGPEEVVEAAKRNEGLFVLLGELALVHRIDVVSRALRDCLGPDWQKGYARKRSGAAVLVPPP